MDVDSAMPLSALPERSQPTATILCCQCGAAIDGTTAIDSLCYDCVKLNVDISKGIQREATLHTCRDCDRWLSPPTQWVTAAPESRELLALCLKKLRGLNKARIIDASFIWTEPHSRRIKVKITIQSEVSQGAILQQAFEVEYVVASPQCPDCAKSFTHNTWRANVQVRQKVPHKRTFLYLEQLILKYGAHKDAINIKEVDSGIDFFFAQRNQAEKFVDFLTSVAPCKTKKSETLISMNVHTSNKSYKFSFSVEIIPICKDDLVALPLRVAQQIGNISPLTICYRVGTSVNLIDPNTLQTADVSTSIFWRAPFPQLADVRELVEFVVMDVEPLARSKGRFILAEATVRRASDLGVNDDEYTTRTHLGALLHPGDSAMGYHITRANFNSAELEAIENSKYGSTIPDVVLVKKAYPRRNKNKKNRNWRLRRMEREEGVESRKKGQGQEEMDYEMFLRDVEEDADMREAMDLYKAERRRRDQASGDGMEGVEGAAAMNRATAEGEEASEEDEDGLEVPLEQLKEEFEGMGLEDENA